MHLAMNTAKYRLAYIIILLLVCAQLNAQYSNRTDTVSVSLQQAEKIFIDSNLSILAAHFNVDAASALIQQAKYWDNPVLNTDQVIAANHNLFPYKTLPDGSPGAQYYFQIAQLIKTAGKRGKLIAAAQTNTNISSLQLQDVIRKLRSQLHIDYYTISRNYSSYRFFTQQQEQLNTLISAMNAELQAGNISQKDFLQLQSLSISLQQDRIEVANSINDAEADLKTILHLDGNTFVKPDINDPSQLSLPDSIPVFINEAKENNPYYKMQVQQTVYQQQLLAYQKALRVPDLTLTPNYDRQANYAPNYFGIGVSVPLPLFNKNKGNIASASFAVQQQQAEENNAENELENNVANAYNKLTLAITQNSLANNEFFKRYDTLYQNMFNSYKARQISLLEFINFFNDYKDLQDKLLQQKLNLLIAADALNYEVGLDVIK
jgi:cobalt-zinc-cadmium efflux system outer membrane protein